MVNKIKLRAMEPEDLDILYLIENDKGLWNVGATNVPYSRYTLHEYMANAKDDIYADRQVRLMVENEAEEVVGIVDVGIVDVVNFDPQHQRAELGIVIMNDHRRKGYATAAVEEILRYALRILHLHQLYVIVDKENTIALQLFRKTEFQESALLAQWLYDGRDYRDALLLQRFL